MDDSNAGSRDLDLEIERSRIEAQSVTDRDLVLTSDNLEKYRNVPMNAIEPLRYAYYLLGNINGRIVMDYGCGSGENSVIMSALGAEVTGIDISPDLIDLNARRMEITKIHWRARAASAYDTGEPDDSFDVVFGAAILHHLDLEAAAREVHRILKPGGKAVFSEPIRDSAVFRWLRKIAPVPVRNASPGEYPLTTAKINSFSSRFERVKSRRFSSPWGRLISRLGHDPHKLIDHVDAWIDNRLTGAFAAFEVFEVRKAI